MSVAFNSPLFPSLVWGVKGNWVFMGEEEEDDDDEEEEMKKDEEPYVIPKLDFSKVYSIPMK